jgi:hypothetical protein
MSVIKLSNGGSLIEDRYSFPDPDIIIRIVFRLEDIKYLKPRSASDVSSVVYFYDDRDYLANLTHYTGETGESPLQRFRQTHSKKEWLKSIRYPLVGMAESMGTPWDIDTRKTIESLCAFKMKTLGFSVVNSQTTNWSHGVSIPPTVNGAYADSVANILVEYQIAHLGLMGVDVKKIASELNGTTEDFSGVTEGRRTLDTDETEFIVAAPAHIKSEEKFEILIKSGLLHVGEPLYLTHRLANKVVTLRGANDVEYREGHYPPREAIKAIAHEMFSQGVTARHTEGWGGYDPLANLSVERSNEQVKLKSLWDSVKHRVTGYEFAGDDETVEVVDEDWLNLVLSSELAGSVVICNSVEAEIGPQAHIIVGDNAFVSLADFAEFAGGLSSEGMGDFRVRHLGEIYTIQST